jgi:ABC-type multidrug transport system, ATPase component
LGIAQAMLHDPDFLILDEPNNGLDPVGINQMADILFKLKQMGKTICISTHLLTEVDRMCTDVAILNQGKLIISGNLSQLTNKKRFYRLEVNDSNTVLNDLKKIKNIKIIYNLENSILISQKKQEKRIEENLIFKKIKDIKSLTRESSLVEYFYD